MRSSRLINRYRADMSVSYGIIQLWGFVILAVIACHWMACLWGYTANASSSGFGNSWMTAFVRGDGLDDDNPLPKWNIKNPKHQYNISEYALMIVMMFLGGFMWAYIIGAVCAITSTLDIKKIEHQQLYDQINNMLVDLAITRPVAASVRSFLFQTEEMERRIGYSDLIEFLSPELQGVLCEEISAKRLTAIKYFQHRSSNFRLALFKRMTRRLFCPQELIYEDRLLIIANQGVIGSDGRIYTSGMALNLDFFLAGELRRAHDARSTTALIRKVKQMKVQHKRRSRRRPSTTSLLFNTGDLVECYQAVSSDPTSSRTCPTP
ncbi:voltage-gated potassium channel [Aureococcus anophagefferens]|nr:voltage-gated potassium channel [Aureococcus anophagefferens]